MPPGTLEDSGRLACASPVKTKVKEKAKKSRPKHEQIRQLKVINVGIILSDGCSLGDFCAVLPAGDFCLINYTLTPLDRRVGLYVALPEWELRQP